MTIPFIVLLFIEKQCIVGGAEGYCCFHKDYSEIKYFGNKMDIRNL